MTRQHKSRFYPSEAQRHLQAQIDELWGRVEKMCNATGRVFDSDEEVRPQRYKIKHAGFGRYQVVATYLRDAKHPGGEAIHTGTLTKAEAQAKLKELGG